MKPKLYKADDLMHVLENTRLTDIDKKIANAKDDYEKKTWSFLYNLVLQQRQLKIIKQKKFIR
ncbi:hypothetical protein [Lactobacillus helveticus]|uniref:hypothetical protein n=1 Tax=Lactobacillus helveticus TaxID=1587 RepID=UPI00197C3312|nr:hypothetical protein [Lactobacillus helveticus]MBN6048990.1 hypothetical protein [Lactobacillus helveticus]